jgi:hypothetical protein
MCDHVQDHVILFSVFREICPGVINHMVCTQRADKVQLFRVIHPSHFRSVVFGKLHSKRTSTATGAIDQNALPWPNLSLITNSLQGNDCSLRDSRGLFKCQTGWFPCQRFFRNTDIFGEATPIRWHFPKYFIPGLKLPDVFAGYFHSPGDIRPKNLVIGPAKSTEAGIQRFASQTLPVRAVDGDRVHLDQYFIVRRSRYGDLFKFENIRRAILVMNNCFHNYSS